MMALELAAKKEFLYGIYETDGLREGVSENDSE
jgi:hypothetical protein